MRYINLRLTYLLTYLHKNIAESLTHLSFADCKLQNRQRYCIGIRLHHQPSWFVQLNCLQTGLLGFIKLVSDSSNRLCGTGKCQTGLLLVWQIDYALGHHIMLFKGCEGLGGLHDFTSHRESSLNKRISSSILPKRKINRWHLCQGNSFHVKTVQKN